MKLRCKILPLAAAVALALPVTPWAADLLAGHDYYSVQLLSAKSPAALQSSLAQLKHADARIDKRGGEYALRVGYWDNRAQAESAAQELRSKFRLAYVRIASYRPDAVVAAAAPS
jgi:hypothetical protein